MKAKSKWLSIFLILGLVLAACSPDGGEGDDTTTTAAESGGDETTTTAGGGDDGTTTTEGDMMDPPETDIGVDLEAARARGFRVTDSNLTLVTPDMLDQRLHFTR